jgi:hypothetical protein
VPNLTVGEDLPPLLGSVPIVEPRTRAALSLVLEDEIKKEFLTEDTEKTESAERR